MQTNQITSLIKWIFVLIIIIVICLTILFLFTDLFTTDTSKNEDEIFNPEIIYSVPTQDTTRLENEILSIENESVILDNRSNEISDERLRLLELILQKESKLLNKKE